MSLVTVVMSAGCRIRGGGWTGKLDGGCLVVHNKACLVRNVLCLLLQASNNTGATSKNMGTSNREMRLKE